MCGLLVDGFGPPSRDLQLLGAALVVLSSSELQQPRRSQFQQFFGYRVRKRLEVEKKTLLISAGSCTVVVGNKERAPSLWA